MSKRNIEVPKESCSVRIKKALTIRGMKQSDLCERAKIPKSSLCEYIKGSHEPKQDNLLALANALEVEPVWLMGYDVPMTGAEASEQPLDINKPEEYWAKIKSLEAEVNKLKAEFGKVWTYCPGCMRSRGVGYSKVAEAYEGTTDPINGDPRPVLRCGSCHSIWKFLD